VCFWPFICIPDGVAALASNISPILPVPQVGLVPLGLVPPTDTPPIPGTTPVAFPQILELLHADTEPASIPVQTLDSIEGQVLPPAPRAALETEPRQPIAATAEPVAVATPVTTLAPVPLLSAPALPVQLAAEGSDAGPLPAPPSRPTPDTTSEGVDAPAVVVQNSDLLAVPPDDIAPVERELLPARSLPEPKSARLPKDSSQPRIKVGATAKDSRTQPTSATELADLPSPVIAVPVPPPQMTPAQSVAEQPVRPREGDQSVVPGIRPSAIDASAAQVIPDVAPTSPAQPIQLATPPPQCDIPTHPAASLAPPQNPPTSSPEVTVSVVSTTPTEPIPPVAYTSRPKPAMNAVDRVLALSSRTWGARAILDVAPRAAGTPTATDETPVAAPPLVVEASDDIAFAMRLKTVEPTWPAPPTGNTVATVQDDEVPAATAPTRVDPRIPDGSPVAKRIAGMQSTTAPTEPQRQHTPDEAVAEPVRTDTRPVAAARIIPHATFQYGPQPDQVAEHSHPEAPRPAHLTEAAPPETGGETKPAGATREIRVQVDDGPHRVEVCLTERAGQVQVAVRTPDAHLAGSLRENLPTLSARLAENGYCAQAWHPTTPTGDLRRSTETSQGNLAQDQNPRSGGQQHDGRQSGGDSRRPKASEAPIQRKEKGKEFEWLMSSLQ
jgi:hypothetical protein